TAAGIESMIVQTHRRKISVTRDSAAVADRGGGTDRAAQRAQIEQGLSDAKKGVILRVADARGVTNDLTEVVQSIGHGNAPPQSAEVDPVPLRPQKCSLRRRLGIKVARHLPGVVEPGHRKRGRARDAYVGDDRSLGESPDA